jgi:predicted PurR-regulated permease PerM
VAIVLVTAVGAAYFGLLGALIGVPLAAGIYGAMRYLSGPVRQEDGSTPEPAPAGEGTF